MQISNITRDPWETDYAALVPRFTGSLSAISSALIIYVIMRSQTRLSSIYHRIMFGMSIADICGSIAMALTSLPMPSYMSKEEIFGYHWAGTRLGNTSTCNAQGFFATFGTTSMVLFNAMLCVYYACAIAFTMKEKNIKKYVEPVLLGLPLVVGLGLAVPPLFYELYNPAISSFAWCTTFTYPLECIEYDYLECVRGNKIVMSTIIFILLALIPLDFFVIVISLLLVIIKVIRTERLLAKMATTCNNNDSNEDMQHMRLRHGNTKAVLVQALCYISAFLSALVLPLFRLVGYLFFGTAADASLYLLHAVIDKAGLVLYPLQGFFNCMIFLSFKVYNYKRFSPDASICSILGLMFSSSAQDPAFISRISIVKMSEEDPSKSNEEGHYKVDVSDEVDDQRHFRLGLLNIGNNISNDDNDDDNLPLTLQEGQTEEVYNPNPRLRNEMNYRLGLFRATNANDPLDVVDEEEEISSSSFTINQNSKKEDELKNVSSGELLSSGSSSGSYFFYPGILEDSKAMQRQLSEQTKYFVNSLLSDCSPLEKKKDEEGEGDGDN
jgi:hypothetical protein